MVVYKCTVERRRRSGFSLTELLLVISVLAILGGLSLSLIRGARYDANAGRTETQIRRIEQFLNMHLEEYLVRVLPYRMNWIRPDQGNPTQDSNFVQRTAVRNRMLVEFLRGEMPCLQAQVSDPSSLPTANNFVSAQFAADFGNYWYDRDGDSPPAFDAGEELVADLRNHPTALVNRMARKLQGSGGWTAEFEGAECLYEILNSHNDAYTSGLDALFADEIGDLDNDGRKEVLDAWGVPLVFVVTVEDLPPGPPVTALPVRPLDGPYNLPADAELLRRLNQDGPAAVRFYVRSTNRLER